LKPMEIEILVVGVKNDPASNEMYRISFDGSIIDERGYVIIGGRSDAIRMKLKDMYRTPSALDEALRISVTSLEDGGNQPLMPSGLEAAVMDRRRPGRKFRRLDPKEIEQYIGKK
jgi:proteasome alpha subunit